MAAYSLIQKKLKYRQAIQNAQPNTASCFGAQPFNPE